MYHCHLNANHSVQNEVIEVIKSSLCDYNDAYIPIRDNITIIVDNVTEVKFKISAPCIIC